MNIVSGGCCLATIFVNPLSPLKMEWKIMAGIFHDKTYVNSFLLDKNRLAHRFYFCRLTFVDNSEDKHFSNSSGKVQVLLEHHTESLTHSFKSKTGCRVCIHVCVPGQNLIAGLYSQHFFSLGLSSVFLTSAEISTAGADLF